MGVAWCWGPSLQVSRAGTQSQRALGALGQLVAGLAGKAAGRRVHLQRRGQKFLPVFFPPSALVGVSPRAMRGSGSCRGCTDGPQGMGTGAQGARSPVWGQEPMGTGAQCGDRCLASPLHEDRRWSRSCDPWGAGPFAGLGGAWAGSPLRGGAGSGRVSVCRPVWAWPQRAVSSGVPSSAGTDLSR